MAVSKSILGISILVSKSISSSISFLVIRSFKGFLCSTFGITNLIFGIETIIEIEGLAVKNGIGLIEEMLRGVLTKSKIETLPKIVVTLGGILIEVFTINELSGIILGTNNVEVNKIVELCEELTVQVDGVNDVANSVAKEVSCSSVDEVFDTSIDVT